MLKIYTKLSWFYADHGMPLIPEVIIFGFPLEEEKYIQGFYWYINPEENELKGVKFWKEKTIDQVKEWLDGCEAFKAIQSIVSDATVPEEYFAFNEFKDQIFTAIFKGEIKDSLSDAHGW
jgi:hypothetical protein